MVNFNKSNYLVIHLGHIEDIKFERKEEQGSAQNNIGRMKLIMNNKITIPSKSTGRSPMGVL